MENQNTIFLKNYTKYGRMWLKSVDLRTFQTASQEETHMPPVIPTGRKGEEVLPTGKAASQGRGEDRPRESLLGTFFWNQEQDKPLPHPHCRVAEGITAWGQGRAPWLLLLDTVHGKQGLVRTEGTPGGWCLNPLTTTILVHCKCSWTERQTHRFRIKLLEP